MENMVTLFFITSKIILKYHYLIFQQKKKITNTTLHLIKTYIGK